MQYLQLTPLRAAARMRAICMGRRRQTGLTLVEVMVSIIVLSIGMLGIAGLQATTSKYKVNTWARSASAILLSELVEKMRVNSAAAGPGYIDRRIDLSNVGSPASPPSEYLLSDDWSTQQGATLTVSKNCETSTCTEAERATYDMSVWRQRVRTLLPQGAALVEGGKGEGVMISLMWMDKEQTDPANATRTLIKAPVCTSSMTGIAQQSCCPSGADAPEGVRCARYFAIP